LNENAFKIEENLKRFFKKKLVCRGFFLTFQGIFRNLTRPNQCYSLLRSISGMKIDVFLLELQMYYSVDAKNNIFIAIYVV